MKITRLAASILLACVAVDSATAQTINFAEYWPLAPGYSWKGYAPAAPDPCSASSPLTWDVHAMPACVPGAFRVGPDPDNSFCVENTGGVFTLHGFYDTGVFNGLPGGAIVMGAIPDGFTGQVEPTIHVVVRDWNAITHADKILYGIDPSLTDVVAWVWYDTNFTGGNAHHAVMEDNLPAGTMLPAGNITDIEWYVKDVGFHAYMDVGAGTGLPWPPVLDLLYTASLDCNGNGIIDRIDISVGTSQDANLDCIPDECACATFCPSLPNATGSAAELTCVGDPNSSLVITSTPVPNTTGQFFFGPMMLLGNPFGDGLLCVGGAVTRVAPFIHAGMMMQLPNTASLTLNYGAPYASSLNGTLYFQHWFRSGLGTGPGYNTSGGLQVTF